MTTSCGLRATTEFSKLPHWLQLKVKELAVADPENWIKRAIPALGSRSVLETLHGPDGEQKLREYFARVTGRF